jgi:hypothetical protein
VLGPRFHALVGTTVPWRKRKAINRLLAAGVITRRGRGYYQINAPAVPVPSCLATMSEHDIRVWLAINPEVHDGLLPCDPTYIASLTGIRRDRVRACLARFTSTGDLIPVTGWLFVYGTNKELDREGPPSGSFPVGSAYTSSSTSLNKKEEESRIAPPTGNLPEGGPQQSNSLTMPDAFRPYWWMSGEWFWRKQPRTLAERLRFCWDASLVDQLAPLNDDESDLFVEIELGGVVVRRLVAKLLARGVTWHEILTLASDPFPENRADILAAWREAARDALDTTEQEDSHGE